MDFTRLPAMWWLRYGDECADHTPGPAVSQLRHFIEQETEVDLLVAQGRPLDGVAVLRFPAPPA